MVDNLHSGIRDVCNSSKMVPAQSCEFVADWWTRIPGAAVEGNVCRKLREFCVTWLWTVLVSTGIVATSAQPQYVIVQLLRA